MNTRSPTRAPSTPLLVAVGGVIVLEALIAARIGFPAFAFHTAVLAVTSGLIVAGSGLSAWRLAPVTHTGQLLVLAGAASFIGPFAHLEWEPVSSIAGELTWLHVAIIGQVILTQPEGRIDGRPMAALVLGLYLLSVITPVDDPVPLAIGLAIAIALRLRIEGRDPRRGLADLAGILVVTGLSIGPILDAVLPWLPLNTQAAAYAAVAAAAVVLASDAVRFAPARARVTDAVLRLTPGAPVSIAAELRLATGDPLLEVGFPLGVEQGYVDAFGRPLSLPDESSKRTATTIEREARTLAVVIHDRRLDTGTALQDAIGRAAGFAAANARLQADLRAQVADLRASRRRIVDAESDARRALERRLETNLLPGLLQLETQLTHAADEAGADDPSVTEVRTSVSDVREQLQRVAEGLHPAVLDSDGLSAALSLLAARSPVPVEVRCDDLPPLPPAITETCWFVSSEALSNIAKHAIATHVRIGVSVPHGSVVMEIADDGVGGADPDRGSGLRGLIDRAEAMGGRLDIDSNAVSGTRLRLELPSEAR